MSAFELSEQDYELLQEAMREASQRMIIGDDEGRPLPRRADVVIEALHEAVNVLMRLPDREVRFLSGLRSAHPEVLLDPEDQKEMREFWITQMERIKNGEAPLEQVDLRPPLPTPREVSRMWVVLTSIGLLVRPMAGRQKRKIEYGNRVYRSTVEIDRKAQDYKILVYLAAGFSARKVGKALGINHQRIMDRRELQSCFIADRITAAYPLFWERVCACDRYARKSQSLAQKT